MAKNVEYWIEYHIPNLLYERTSTLHATKKHLYVSLTSNTINVKRITNCREETQAARHDLAPTVENMHSLGTFVADIGRYRKAILAIRTRVECSLILPPVFQGVLLRFVSCGLGFDLVPLFRIAPRLCQVGARWKWLNRWHESPERMRSLCSRHHFWHHVMSGFCYGWVDETD